MNYPKLQKTWDHIERIPEVVRTKATKKVKTILTLEEDAKLRHMEIDVSDPSEVQIKLGIFMNITGFSRPKTYFCADANFCEVIDKKLENTADLMQSFDPLVSRMINSARSLKVKVSIMSRNLFWLQNVCLGKSQKF